MSVTSSESSPSGLATYKRLLGYANGYIRYFIIAVVGMIVYAFAEMQMAGFIKILVDEAFIEKNPETIAAIPVMLAFIILGRSGGSLVGAYFMSWVSRGVIKGLREDMFQKLMRLPNQYYDKKSSGEIIASFSFDVEQVAESTASVITALIRDTFLVVFLLWLMFSTSAKLSLVLFVTVPVAALIVYSVSFRFRKVSRRIQQSIGKVTHVVNEAVEGQQIVKLYGGEKSETQNFNKANQHNFVQNLKLALTKAFSGAFVQFVAGVALVCVVTLATSGLVGEITPGIFSAFIVAMARMAPPLKHLTNINVQLQKGIAAAQSIFLMLDAESEKDLGQISPLRVQGKIEYRNVSFNYEDQTRDVLSEVSFIAEPGQTVALVGRSGSGKSTIAKLLARFYDCERGFILLDGQNINDYKLAELRNQIAFVGQNVTLFNDTIANNIAYGVLSGASREDIERAAKAAYAIDFINRLPDGFDTVLGEDGAGLSGGERQRLSIARAFLKDSPILILDEATSALDSESAHHIQAALDNLLKERTTIVIAHRLSTVEKADNILVLDEGGIIESGTHQELLQKDDQYASVYKLQFKTDLLMDEPPEPGLQQSAQLIDYPSYDHNFLSNQPDATLWERMWYGHHPMAQLLAPLGYLFGMLVSFRRFLYKRGVLNSQRFPVPVIVVGNITVGGTGKTPLVIWLANHLSKQGYKPGIVSRGYKGKATEWPLLVTGESDPQMVGDEAAMIVHRTQCPMVIGPNRREDVTMLLEQYACDIIIADDGMQHYALARDIEIVVADGRRGFGNGMMLPAGPMREPKSRLAEINYIIINGANLPDAYSMYVKGDTLVNLGDVLKTQSLKSFAGQRVHAVAAIGNPERFFELLRGQGLYITEHRYADHHDFVPGDLIFEDQAPVIMTEKDAVKCRKYVGLFDPERLWFIPVNAQLDDEFTQKLSQHIEALLNEQEAA